MQTHAPPNHFQACLLCQNRFGEHLPVCPYLKTSDGELSPEALAKLQAMTPFAEWLSPQVLGERYNYSPKHIIRLAQMMPHQIIAVNIQGRWFILRCSLEHYLRGS